MNEDGKVKIVSRAIVSTIIICIALVAIFVTPNLANLGIIIGALFLIAVQFAPLFSNKKIIRTILSIFGVVVAIGSILFSLAYSCVDVGHTGILVTFGKVSPQTYESGIHWKPFWSTMVQMDNRIKTISGETSKFSKDIQEVKVTFAVNYQINKQNASKIYQTIGQDYINTVAIKIPDIIEGITTKYTAEDMVDNRTRMTKEFQEQLKPFFAQYNIDLLDAMIKDIDYTDTFTNAVEAKVKAQQDKLRAEAEAEQKKVEADGKAYVVVAEAEAEAKANELRQKTLTDLLIKDKMLDKWDGKLPLVSDGNALIDMRSLIGSTVQE